ncbi:MAG: tRNA (N(6)-L-threonylcarbamoyladenosine(37)-C(2))-methylthiotransferase MtaB [Faecousia sp.]
MKFHCFTLGCKVNQYETQAMEQQLVGLGHEPSAEADSDVLIVNTCTVTAVADRKNRTLLHRLRREHPDALLGVCGCYSQISPEEAAKTGADVVSGSGGREEFLQRLLALWREKEAGGVCRQDVAVDNALQRRTFECLPAGGMRERTRAMLKVQDGCNNFCTYCIIPYARGPVRSEPLDRAVAQTRALAEAGYREVVVTGIEIASWGWDLKDGSSFADLAEAVCATAGTMRVRLGSLEPRVVDEDFCRRLSAFDNLCPQFHLSLQSGSNTVLQRMRRKYDTARYLQSVRLLRQWFPGCAVTTDLIVGFPGETEAELEESLAFVRECGFAAMHVFPYSRRPGTPADAMPNQVPKAVKTERAARASAVAEELRLQYDTALIGSVQEVLFEQTEDGFFTGHAKNYVKVYARGDGLHNVVKQVRITALRNDGIEGELLP